jgi:hypothetical protein
LVTEKPAGKPKLALSGVSAEAGPVAKAVVMAKARQER